MTQYKQLTSNDNDLYIETWFIHHPGCYGLSPHSLIFFKYLQSEK